MANRSGPVVLQVYIFKDGEYLGTDIFAERQIIVGRDPDEAHLVLESPQVSRKHALIELEGTTVRVRDAGSTNGVFVNDQRVGEPVSVGRLDEIKVGEYTLKLKLQGKGAPKMDAELTQSVGDGEVGSTQIMTAEGQAALEYRSAKAVPALAAPVAPASKKEPEPTPDLSEFDDVSDEEPVPNADAKRYPKAEFRKRSDVVDGDGLDDMLQGIGIESREARKSSPESQTETRANVPKPQKKNDSASGKPSKKKNGAKGEAFPALRASPATAALEAAEHVVDSLGKENWAAKSGGLADESTLARDDRDRPAKGARGDRGSAEERELDDEQDDRERDDREPARRGSELELAPPPSGYDDDDDDDHEEEGPDWAPSYSLAKHILTDESPLKGGVPRVEVVALRGDLVDHVVVLEPGESYWIGPALPLFQRPADAPPRFQMVKYKSNRQLDVEFRENANGYVVRNAQQVALSALSATRGRSQKRRGTSVTTLSRGEVMQVDDGHITYSVREVVAPAPPRDDRPLGERLIPDRAFVRSAGGSVGGHVFFALLFSVLASVKPIEPTVAKEEFIEVSIEQDMKLEQPPPEPPQEEPPPPEQKPAEKIPPKAEAAPKKIKQQKVGGVSPAPAGVLGLLNKTGSSAAPGPATAVAAISNLAAAKVPSGTSGYKVSGLIGKMPTSELSIGGGGGGPMTKGAAELLRGGAGGAGSLSGKGTRAVGGLVQKVPQQMRAAGQGTLDRDEIQKVINKNIGQIQRCYERELLKSAGLQGKVQVEWTVGMSGAVKSTRQKFSDMDNTNVVNCILGAIKGWEFPQPKGGEVVVSYPFIFKPIGF